MISGELERLQDELGEAREDLDLVFHFLNDFVNAPILNPEIMKIMQDRAQAILDGENE